MSDAYALIRERKAEWVVGDRGGKPYVFRNAIIITQTVDEAIEVAADRAAAHAAELDIRAAERKDAARQKKVATIIMQFRSNLRREENAQWSDEQILEAFETKDPVFMDLPFMNGAGAKHALKSATNKEIAEQPNFFRELADSARIHGAFYRAVLDYWNKVKLVADYGLSDDRGRYLTGAPKGAGELVSGGYGVDKIAQIDGIRSVQRETFRSPHDDDAPLENNGCKKRKIAHFVPGSGGLRVNVKGGIVEADPVYSGGTDPIQYEEGSETKAKLLREKWLDEQRKTGK